MLDLKTYKEQNVCEYRVGGVGKRGAGGSLGF